MDSIDDSANCERISFGNIFIKLPENHENLSNISFILSKSIHQLDQISINCNLSYTYISIPKIRAHTGMYTNNNNLKAKIENMVNVHDYGVYNLSYKSAIAVQRIKDQFQKQEESNKGKRRCREGQGGIRYEVVRMWKEEMMGRQKLEGWIRVKNQDDLKSIQQAIYADLSQKGHKFRKNTLLLITPKKQTQVIIESKTKIRQTYKIGKTYIKCLLIEPKINLPESYTYLPTIFTGFYVRNLSISNQNGTVTWNCPVDITNIDFSQESIIQIQRDSIKISFQKKYDPLHTDILVEFYKIPEKLEKYKSKYNQQQMQNKLRKCVQDEQKGCRLVSYQQHTGHWFMHIMLSMWKNKLKIYENKHN